MSDMPTIFTPPVPKCVAGDTLVFIKDSGGNMVRMPVQDLWEAHQEMSLDGRGVKLYAFDPYRDNFYFDNLRDVVAQGERETVLVRFKSGRVLRAVPGHRVLTNQGLDKIERLTIGSPVVTVPFEDRKIEAYNTLHMWSMPRAAQLDEIVAIEPAGICATYDVDMYGADRNYVANGIVVRTL